MTVILIFTTFEKVHIMKIESKTVFPSRSSLFCGLLALAGAMSLVQQADAETWSDTSLSWRYGTKFAEPFVNQPDGSHLDIAKNIVAFTHVGGYSYGTNFFNVDILMSDRKNPSNGVAGNAGATEAYVVYRNTVNFSKVFKQSFAFGPIRDVGVTGGFDLNTKNDYYGSKKRMLVLGPTLMFDVPGFVNLSALALDESNSPNGLSERYTYKLHPAVELDWGIPIMNLPLSFEGYALWIASKGKNEYGGATSPEFHVDAKLMYDLGSTIGLTPKTLKVGAEYEYWHNKFGNPTWNDTGATASTPMIRAEYHF